ncbi:MAG: cation:proton antiporter subunit C [Gemmatimonadota bacterium]
MSSYVVYVVGAGLLLVVGVHGALTARHLVRLILALNVMSGGVFLALIAISARGAGSAAGPDPVPQALVLTGIVVAVSITAFVLALARRIHALSGRTSLSEEDLE